MTTLETIVTPLGWLLRNRRAGERLSVRHAEELATPGRVEISSPAFAHGGTIPDRHSSGGRRENLSPPLHWSAVPDATRELLLIIEDIDTPTRHPGVHTVALFAPTGSGLDEGALTPDNPHVQYVPAQRGRTGYVGPRPLPGHGVHRYGFHLYALDTDVDLTGIDSLEQLLPRVAGHVLASGIIEGVRAG